MKKILFISVMIFLGSISFYSCTTGHGGGCDAFGGSHNSVHVKVGKGL